MSAYRREEYVADLEALLESEGELMLKKNGNEGRYFVFSQPFMLYLKEKNAKYPYLAIWVNNPEFLIKDEKKD